MPTPTTSARLAALLCAAAPLLAQGSRPTFAVPKELAGYSATLAPGKVPPAHPKQRVAYGEALVARLPAERYTLSAAAEKLEGGVGPAFQLVRERVRFESYAGVLRGAELCFAARAGNALDRSLVLAKLLAAKGIATRFVRGKLPREHAEALVERIFARDPGTPLPAPTGDVQRSDLPDRVLARAKRDYGIVRAALGKDLPGAALPTHDALVAEVTDHFWLQAKDGKQWVDLDSAFPGAKVGEAFAKPEQTFTEVPDELHQHVTFRIVTENVVNRALVEKVVLEVKTTSEKVVDAQVLLAHAPDSAQRGIGNTLAGTGIGYAPVLWIGGESHAGERIDYGIPGKAAVADALAAEPPKPKPSPFVAEQLEIEVAFPDGRTDVVRRALVDRAGPAWRAQAYNDIEKLEPLATNERGPIDVQGVHCILASGGKHDVSSFAQSVLWLARELLAEREAEEAARAAGKKAAAPAGAMTDDDPVATLWPFYLQNLGWMIWSDHVAVPGLDDVDGLRSYVDSPRIWIASLWIVGDDLKTMFDLRRDTVRTVARDPKASALAAAERKLWFAIVEGALEHEAVAERAACSGAEDVEITTTSSRLDEKGVTVLTKGALDKVAELVGSDARKGAYLRQALERDSVVVAPKTALGSGPLAWWEIQKRGDARAVVGEDWNGARFQGAGYYRRMARGPSGGEGRVYRPGKYRSPGSTPGGKSSPKTGKGAGGGELGEYLTAILEVSVPAAYGWFVVGLGVEVTAGTIGAMIIEETAR